MRKVGSFCITLAEKYPPREKGQLAPKGQIAGWWVELIIDI